MPARSAQRMVIYKYRNSLKDGNNKSVSSSNARVGAVKDPDVDTCTDAFCVNNNLTEPAHAELEQHQGQE